MNFAVIGIPNNPDLNLSEEVKKLLGEHRIFSGGTRHYQLVKKHLPEDHEWISIKGNMERLFQQYEQVDQPIIVFASGDPLFYGFASTILKYSPESCLKVYPWFNSLQILCHKRNISYEKMVPVSIHGRAWKELDEALIKQNEFIGVLTDQQNTPAAIANRALEYDFSNYRMIIGEALEGDEEKISDLTLGEAKNKEFNPLNCVLLLRTKVKIRPFGIEDTAFSSLPGRPNMITKMPVRLATLSALDLFNRQVLWDIGFCTGSVSIEAKSYFPHLAITAFEKRPECEQLFEENTRKHSVPGISKAMGDFFELDHTAFPAPDAVFIGGHGSRLEEMIKKLDTVLKPAGRMVMNTVREESENTFTRIAEQLQYRLLKPITMMVDKHNKITIVAAEKPAENGRI